MSISLSARANEKTTSHYHYKAGDKVQEEVWCYNASNLNSLRNGLEDCEKAKIELKHTKALIDELKKTEVSHKPIWRQWWFKLPVGIAAGVLGGYLAGEHDASPTLAGVAGGLVGATTVVLLDLDF